MEMLRFKICCSKYKYILINPLINTGNQVHFITLLIGKFKNCIRMRAFLSEFSGLLVLISIFLFTSCSSEVEVATSENYEVVELPDGSEVFLNHSSSVTYDKEFNPRTIQLQGEAFFFVDPGQTPFIVKTATGEVKVTGTEFNVKADENDMEVEVEGGHVEFNAGEHRKALKKGSRGAYNKSRNEFKKGKAQFKFRVWMHELAVEFKAIGREFKHTGKEIGREGKKMGKEIGKEGKNLGKEIRKEFR
jgi:hypothetical protein